MVNKLLFFSLLLSSQAMAKDEKAVLGNLKEGLAFITGEGETCAEDKVPQEAVVVCSKPEEEDEDDKKEVAPLPAPPSILAMKITDIPPEITPLIPFDILKNVSPSSPIFISLLHVNDNALWSGGPDSEGFTGRFGVHIGGIKINKGILQGYTIGVVLDGSMYSARKLEVVNTETGKKSLRRLHDDWKAFGKTLAPNEKLAPREEDVQLQSTDENTIVSIMLNKANDKNTVSYGFGGGLAISGPDKVFMGHLASGLHSLPGFQKYQRVENDGKQAYNAYLEAYVSARKALINTSGCSVDLRGTFSGSFDTGVGRRRFVTMDVDLNSGFIDSRDHGRKLLGISLGGQVQTDYGTAQRSLATLKSEVSYNFKRVSLGFGYLKPMGKTYSANYLTTDMDYHRRGSSLGLMKLTIFLPK